MANNKIQLANGTVLLDISDTTSLVTDVVSNKVFYAKDGTRQTGTLIIQGYYEGNGVPSNSLGDNDDIYLMIGD